ncbi:MAG: hypothetical protein FJ272_13645 [Planctomycetes bacterium]|nr:hypothetical protein [Planctomycetota bacterium]
MSIPDKTYAKLRARAKAQGVSVGKLITRLAEDEGNRREERFWQDMRAKGLVVDWPKPSEPPPKQFRPIKLAPGSPLVSEIILKDRR